jgi:hypothetical protein
MLFLYNDKRYVLETEYTAIHCSTVVMEKIFSYQVDVISHILNMISLGKVQKIVFSE